MSDRCEDGRLMRHKPFPDDPYFEHDVGRCPECDGKGCDRGLQHEFEDPLGACRACGLYVEECMEVPFCAGVKVERNKSGAAVSADEEGEVF